MCAMGNSNISMSSCTNGRSTYYDYVGFGNNGACSFKALGGTYLPTLNVAAPNELFYNNASHCGECWELTGPKGSVVVMIADMCPADSFNPQCHGDIDHFDLGSTSTFANLAPTTAGDVLMTKRQVACPVNGNVGILLEATSSSTWLGILVYNHKVGITKVELQNLGTWYSLPRASYNYWHYSIAQFPNQVTGAFNVRITAQTGDTITIPVSGVLGG